MSRKLKYRYGFGQAGILDEQIVGFERPDHENADLGFGQRLRQRCNHADFRQGKLPDKLQTSPPRVAVDSVGNNVLPTNDGQVVPCASNRDKTTVRPIGKPEVLPFDCNITGKLAQPRNVGTNSQIAPIPAMSRPTITRSQPGCCMVHFFLNFFACTFCFCIFFCRWANFVAGFRGVWRWFLEMVMVLLFNSIGIGPGSVEWRALRSKDHRMR